MPSTHKWNKSASDADLARELERAECVLQKFGLLPDKADEAAGLRDCLEWEIGLRLNSRELDEMCREDAEELASMPAVTEEPMTLAEGLAILDKTFAADDHEDDEAGEDWSEWAERALMGIDSEL